MNDVVLANGVVFAGVALLLAGSVLLYVRGRRNRRREAVLLSERAELAADYIELEASKQRSEAESSHLNSIMSGMSDGVMMLDANFNLVQWNENFASFTGTPRDILRVGLPMESIIRAQAGLGEFGDMPNDERREAEIARRMRLVRRVRHIDITERLRPDGRVLETRRRALPDGGLVTLYTDITARRRAEAAQRELLRVSEAAIEQKAQFVAMVSHEIRVPLNAVTGSLALLDQSSLSAQQRSHVETARHAGDTLLDLINDILDLSKIDAGQLQLRPVEFAIRPMLQGIADMFEPQARARGISLKMEVAADVPPLLHADGGRLRQVLMNFASNAIKFSRPGSVTLRATREAAVRPPATALPGSSAGHVPGAPAIRLTVCDQGPRISVAEAALLYEPFARLDYAREAGIPGTGLGLTICKQLARLMGGELGLGPAVCDDGADDGNAFWIAFPLESPAELPGSADVRPGMTDPGGSATATTRPVSDTTVLATRPRRRAGVLLVEDVATNRILTSALLRREGHRVDAVDSGEDAVARVAQQPFDVVFMDLNMPGIDGCEATRRIRALSGPAGQVPIVALTATDRSAVLPRCREAGMNDVLGKPTRPRELFDMLDRMVRPVDPLQPIATPAPPPAASSNERTDPDITLIDGDRLLDLQRGLPAGLFASLVEQCLDDIAARMIRLDQALRDRETVAAVGAAHALAGMSGSYGMAALERRMRTIMHAADVGDIETASAAARGMTGELERSALQVRALLQAQAA